jgi:hypothetical protein
LIFAIIFTALLSKDADGAPMRAFLTCDGEPVQIEVFQEPEMIEAFKTALIDFGKTPASCSAICQPSDVSNFFKASKKKLQNSFERDYGDADLEKKLLQVLGNRNYNSEKKGLICDALLLVIYSIKETLTLSMVRHGYERCGQYPIDFDKQMRLCSGIKDVSENEYKNMVKEWPDMVKKFKEAGELTEDVMNTAKIYKVPNAKGKPKHTKVLHQQRAVLMNSQECISRFKLYKASKQSASEIAAAKRVEKAIKKQQQAQMSEEEKRLQRNQKAREKRANNNKNKL